MNMEVAAAPGAPPSLALLHVAAANLAHVSAVTSFMAATEPIADANPDTSSDRAFSIFDWIRRFTFTALAASPCASMIALCRSTPVATASVALCSSTCCSHRIPSITLLSELPLASSCSALRPPGDRTCNDHFLSCRSNSSPYARVVHSSCFNDFMRPVAGTRSTNAPAITKDPIPGPIIPPCTTIDIASAPTPALLKSFSVSGISVSSINALVSSSGSSAGHPKPATAKFTASSGTSLRIAV
mmetsp:Transcript_9930/g.19906  ORF Transcript_9930/g.19906 Transcript_9930/m.19906 type:complete len:243 (-) Transcript_9930:248-976(-)